MTENRFSKFSTGTNRFSTFAGGDDFAARAAGMTHEDKVAYYRSNRDAFADFLAEDIQKPKSGETPEQAKLRAGGSASTIPKWYSALSGVADTLNFGFTDEATAGVESALTDKTYDQSLADARLRDNQAYEQNPWTYRGGQVAGAVLPAAATMGGSGGGTLGGQVVRGAGAAGAQGATYGFGVGEDGAVNRSKSALINGLTSAVLGGAAPLVSRGIGSTWNYVASKLANRGVDAQSVQKVLAMLKESNVTPQQAMQKLDELGPDGMLADIAPGMQAETGGTAIADSGAGSIITRNLANRREAAPARVTGMLDQTFGPFKGPQTIADDISTARAPAGSAYELAKTHVVDPENAIAKIDELMKTFGPNSDTGQALAKYKSQLLDPSGNVVGQGNIVHGVRQEIDAALRRGNLPNSGPFRQVRGQLDESLKTQIPGFKEADNLWSDTARIQEAYDYGKDALLGRVFPDESAAKFAKMADPEKQAVLQGVRADLAMKTANSVKNPAGRMDRVLDQNMNEQKLAQLIDPNKLSSLRKGLDKETTFLETSGLAEGARGSRTAIIGQAAKNRWNVGAGPSNGAGDVLAATAAGLATGGPLGAVAGGGAVAANRGRSLIASLLSSTSPDLIKATAEKLTASGANRDAVVKALLGKSAANISRAAKSDLIDRLVKMVLQSQAPLAGNSVSRALIPSDATGSPR